MPRLFTHYHEIWNIPCTRYKKLKEYNFQNEEISKLILKPISEFKKIEFSNFQKPSGEKIPSNKFMGFNNKQKLQYEKDQKQYSNQILYTYVIKEKNKSHRIHKPIFIKSYENKETILEIISEDYEIGILNVGM